MDYISWVKQTLAVALGEKTWFFSNNCVVNTFLFYFDSAFRWLFSSFLLLIFSFGMLGIIIQSIWKHDWKVRWPGTKGISNTWSNFVGLVSLPSLHPLGKRRNYPPLQLLRETMALCQPRPTVQELSSPQEGNLPPWMWGAIVGFILTLQEQQRGCSQRGKQDGPPETARDALRPELPLMLWAI